MSVGAAEPVAAEDDSLIEGDDDELVLLRQPPLNMALTSSQAKTISSGGEPVRWMCRRHELKLAASGCTYLASGRTRCEWKMNLFGEKNRLHMKHLMHLAREELYRDGRKAPRQPQAH